MRWFRMYSEFAHDPKIQSMGETSQRRFVMLLCLRCDGELEKLTDDEIAFALRIDPNELQKSKELFIKKGFIDDKWNILNWDKRQYTAERKQQYRHMEKRESLGLPRRRWINPKVRSAVQARDKQACVYCASKTNLTIDHIIPEIKGGSNGENNLVVACRACNAKKREFRIDQVNMRYRDGYSPPPGELRQASLKQASSNDQASTDTDTDTDINNNPPTPQEGDDREKQKTWKNDFSIYLGECEKSAQQLLSDPGWIAEQEVLNPDVDIRLTMRKACTNYWGTEVAWSKKKRQKIKEINWKLTWQNALSSKMNRVYKRAEKESSDFVPKEFDFANQIHTED